MTTVQAANEEAKMQLTDVGQELFERRYRWHNEDSDGMFTRVAEHIALAENKEQRSEYKDKFFELMSSLRFLPNSPTLFNAGTGQGLLSACFTFYVEDSLVSIMECHRLAGLVMKYGGGVGYGFSRVRPAGAEIKTVQGKACGPVNLLPYYNGIAELITQGGRRSGAQIGILSVEHPDIRDFIHFKDENPDSLQTFNISVAINDGFMERYQNGDIEARQILKEISESAWRTGDPGVWFIDTVNAANSTPWLGRLESCNPCLSPDTLIATKDGLIPIKDIPQAWKSGYKPIYKITTLEGYEVFATADHQFYTQEEGWTSVKQLEDKRIRICNTSAFGIDGNRDIGLVLGWLSGDGHISENQKSILCFDKIEKSDACTVVLNAYQNILGFSSQHTWGRQTRVASMKLSRLSTSWQPDEKFPERMLIANEECQSAYLSALFSADGTVTGTQQKGISVRLSSSKLHLLRRVQLLLRNFNIYSKIYQNRRFAGYRDLPDQKGGTKEYYCEAQHELVISNTSLRQFANEIGFIVHAKQERLIHLLSQYKRAINLDSEWARVKTIEYFCDGDVWDISSITESISANGLLAHNCGEVPLYHAEACNLGSLNLGKYFDTDTRSILWDKLKSDIRLAARFLDDVIDVNSFPDPIITAAVSKTRKIGLGVMGWADVLALSDIPYDSDTAINLAGEVMEFIQKTADRASYELGQERGIAPAFDCDEAPSVLGLATRNVTRTCIAPTGSISQLAGCSSGIEPHYELEYKRTMFDKGVPIELHVREPVLDILQELGLNLPKTALEISPEWHIKHQAAFQRYTNLAVSKTINLPETATVNDIETSFVKMWESGCKGGTIYRDKSRETQVLGENRRKVNGRKRLPDERKSITHKFKVGDQEGYLTVGLYDDGKPGELFVKIAKEGSTVAGVYDAIGIQTSLLLQYGVSLESIAGKLSGMRFEPSGLTSNPEIPFAFSIPDYIYRWLMSKFGSNINSPVITGLFCPDCTSQLLAQEGCLKCENKACGFNRCG